MKIVLLLHFYQPHNQQHDILNRIVHESYLPIIEIMKNTPDSKAVFNISGVLLKLLQENGYTNVIEGFRDLVNQNKVELTGSAMYHAFLPLLPKDEMSRQISLNNDIGSHIFGNKYRPLGFFSPEMAVDAAMMRELSKLGYKWMAAPEISYGGGRPDTNYHYVSERSDISVFFRNKRVSALILSAASRSAEDLWYETSDLHDDNYWFTVMDAETFGHHRVGHEELLHDIFISKHFESVFASDLLEIDLKEKKVQLRPSTWTNEEQDFWLDKEKTKSTSAKSFILWKDPSNPIHLLQWEFLEFVLEELNSFDNKNSKSWASARDLMDKAISSDQFWWASAKPWWSLEMVEQGAYMLMQVLKVLEPENSKAMSKAENYYQEILGRAFEWQRSGYIRKRHLENSATFMKTPFRERAPAEWYNQIVLEFEDEMKKAANNRDFEKAVKWRDALTKLDRGTDIYDVLHVVDELWSARNIPSIKPFLSHNWSEFSEYARSMFRGAVTKEDFEIWKKERKPPKE